MGLQYSEGCRVSQEELEHDIATADEIIQENLDAMVASKVDIRLDQDREGLDTVETLIESDAFMLAVKALVACVPHRGDNTSIPMDTAYQLAMAANAVVLEAEAYLTEIIEAEG